MIITLKTLQQQTFKIEIDQEATVKALKEKIEKEKGAEAFPAGGQKLIYAGKILEDEKPVSLYKMDEKNFVVVMVTKPKPASTVTPPTPASTATTAAQASAEACLPEPTLVSPTAAPIIEAHKQEGASPTAPEAHKQVESTETSASMASTADTSLPSEMASSTATARSQSHMESSVAPELSTISAESALVTGQQYEDVVAQMVNMGFPRDQVQRAMRASFNNPDRAVEYLFNGIPEMLREEPPPAAAAPQPADIPAQGTTAPRQPTSTGANQPLTGPGSSSPGQLTGPPVGARVSGEDTLAFLRDQPQFQHMRNLIQTNPQLLPELLQQIGRSNPQLLQMISQNQEQFIAMLNEQVESAQGGVGGRVAGRSPGEGVIHVTLEEKEAIERLKALGFSEAMCIQAYFACEKNEELAANYLLSHGFDDDNDS